MFTGSISKMSDICVILEEIFLSFWNNPIEYRKDEKGMQNKKSE